MREHVKVINCLSSTAMSTTTAKLKQKYLARLNGHSSNPFAIYNHSLSQTHTVLLGRVQVDKHRRSSSNATTTCLPHNVYVAYTRIYESDSKILLWHTHSHTHTHTLTHRKSYVINNMIQIHNGIFVDAASVAM